MAAKTKTYSVHAVIILVILSIPMLQAFIKYQKRESPEDITYNKPDLTGLVISDVKPEFNRENWFSGEYQKETDDYNADHWSMKEFMVRSNNQFYYNAFHQIRVNGFVLGKEDYVFSENYIYSAFGDDLVDEKRVSDLLKKAKVLQDTLKRKGIDLLLVYAPGKGEYCREFIADKYVHPVKTTNYDLFIKHSKANALNYFDIYGWFNQMKPTAKYPLFPKFGHHWSFYGEVLAVDSLIHHIEKLHRCDLPDIAWEKIDVVDSARSRDADVLKSMNLLHNPPQNMQLAYPEVLFENDSTKNVHPVLTISDSYWYGPVFMGIPQNCFAGGSFWYYYNKVVPSQKVEVWELDLKQQIESNEVIMLLYADGNLPSFGNNFINDAYELYTSPKTYYERAARQKQIQQYAKEIRNSPLMLKRSTAKSSELAIPLDSAIKLDAMKMAGLIK